VAAMGGPGEVLRKGREALAAGEERWAAELLNHLVFADPENAAARELLASSYDQLGYRAESAPWRDVYLTAALELRSGPQGSGLDPRSAANLLRHLPVGRFFTAMATRLRGLDAAGKDIRINFVFTDLGETHVVHVENGVLHHEKQDAPDPDAAVTMLLTRDFLVRMVTGDAGLRDMIFSDDVDVDGSRFELLSFFSLLDRPAGDFPIVTP
jgi:alkyl sulfatase BDS1-like metallo-beta-lactamase superfamily hydrolase